MTNQLTATRSSMPKMRPIGRPVCPTGRKRCGGLRRPGDLRGGINPVPMAPLMTVEPCRRGASRKFPRHNDRIFLGSPVWRRSRSRTRMIRQRASWTPIRPSRPRSLRRVLAALDGTSESETILRHLRDLLGPRPVVVMIHVLPDSQGRGEREAIRYLSGVPPRFPEFRSRRIVEAGDPAERILEAARDE